MASSVGYWDRLGRARIGRRRALAGAASLGLGAAALGVVGCGGGDDSAKGEPGVAKDEGTPKPGGIWKQVTITVPTHFSPVHPGADPSWANTWRRSHGYYDALWGNNDTTDPARQVHTRLAESIEQPDQTTIIVKMRQSFFHDQPASKSNADVKGRQADAEDVAATINYLATARGVSTTAFLTSGRDLKSAKAVDKLTVRYELAGPRAFFYEQANPNVLPREMLDEKALKENIPIGTGPYMYKSHQLNAVEEMVRNPRYFITGRPYLDGKQLTWVGDPAADEAAFRANQVDDKPEAWLNIKIAEAVARDLGNKIKNLTIPSTSGMAIVMNINRDPWKDIRVREAVYRAVDLDKLIRTIYFGDANKSWYFSDAQTARFPIGRKAVEQYVGYDPQKARQLLQASGADLSKTFGIMVPPENQTWVDGGVLVSEELKAVGFKMQVDPVVRNIYLQRGGPQPGDFDLMMSVYLDYYFAKSEPGHFWASTTLKDPEVDALIAKIEEEMDSVKRAKLSSEFEQMLARKYSNFMPMVSSNVHYSSYAYMKGINYERSRNGTGGWQIDRWKDKQG